MHLRLAEFASEVELIGALGPGEIFIQMTGNIGAALGRGHSEWIESCTAGRKRAAVGRGSDDQVGRARNGGAGIEPQPTGIEAGLGVGENLLEITHAGAELVGHGGREDPVIDQRVVLNVRLGILEVGRQLRGTGGSLYALADEVGKGDVVLVGEFLVDFADAVVAVSVGNAGSGVVVRLRQARGGRRDQRRGRPQTGIRAAAIEQVMGNRIGSDAPGR